MKPFKLEYIYLFIEFVYIKELIFICLKHLNDFMKLNFQERKLTNFKSKNCIFFLH